ncbi:MAG: RdgB/HAM1 family non-canonical purine NTP pyrophosphatase [Lachnospiraceae bacterium]|nr:RdgB/HAM1 family non-canonical purine NTP pyrophosphatase [Lachnospiraceae bacterium]
MQRIIFATGNAGKMREIKMILSDLVINGEAVEVVSMKEAGIDTDIVEDGASFAENAVIKAQAVAAFAPDAIVMADDSGLEVDHLNKEPGIYSARYLGEDTPYSEKNANIISRLEGVPVEERSARFVCAIAAALPGGEVLQSLETIEGYIGYEERGDHGFGYDPIFMVPSYNKSTAELTEEEKNEISHRGKALRAMKQQLQAYYDSAEENA